MRSTVPIKGLDQDLSGLTIAQISDLHVGPTIKEGYVEEVVEKVNRLNPDIIAVTGDLVDGSVEYLAKHVEPLKTCMEKLENILLQEIMSITQAWINGSIKQINSD